MTVITRYFHSYAESWDNWIFHGGNFCYFQWTYLYLRIIPAQKVSHIANRAGRIWRSLRSMRLFYFDDNLYLFSLSIRIHGLCSHRLKRIYRKTRRIFPIIGWQSLPTNRIFDTGLYFFYFQHLWTINYSAYWCFRKGHMWCF